jgi:hypothetical protein
MKQAESASHGKPGSDMGQRNIVVVALKGAAFSEIGKWENRDEKWHE